MQLDLKNLHYKESESDSRQPLPPPALTPQQSIRQQLSQRWPEAVRHLGHGREQIFPTGLPELDSLLPMAGIPCGQLIEITGGASSGKTSLVFRFMAALTAAGNRVAYVDFSRSFFPDAAAVSGVDLKSLLVVTAGGQAVPDGIRTGELLLRENRARVVVFDLAAAKHPLPLGLLHRLRLRTVRARGLVVFLTQHNSEIIPSSMASLRLTANRTVTDRYQLEITKSRICPEGKSAEVTL